MQFQTVSYIGIASGVFSLFGRDSPVPFEPIHFHSFIIRSVYVAVGAVCASQSSLIRSAPFSPIIIVGAFVLPLLIVGTR